MNLWIVTRHPGARTWLQQQIRTPAIWVEHLELSRIGAGDIIIGTLPLQLAAEVLQRGARYIHLCLNLEASQRGTELDSRQMHQAQARLLELQQIQLRPITPEALLAQLQPSASASACTRRDEPSASTRE